MVVAINAGFKTGELKKLPDFEQFVKLNDRMIALLAVIYHVQPAIKINEAILRTINEKHGEKVRSASELEKELKPPDDGRQRPPFSCASGATAPRWVRGGLPPTAQDSARVCAAEEQ
jgi:hypothetical protein